MKLSGHNNKKLNLQPYAKVADKTIIYRKITATEGARKYIQFLQYSESSIAWQKSSSWGSSKRDARPKTQSPLWRQQTLSGVHEDRRPRRRRRACRRTLSSSLWGRAPLLGSAESSGLCRPPSRSGSPPSPRRLYGWSSSRTSWTYLRTQTRQSRLHAER